MKDESRGLGGPEAGATGAPGMPTAVDRATFQAELDGLRVREKAHTREGDAIAAARRRLPMVEVDASTELIGPQGPVTLLDAFDGRQQLIAYYFMWHPGHPAAEQCEGCTWVTTQVAELSYLHSRDITFAVLCQGPYDESSRYREFMGWNVPWYSAQASLNTLLGERNDGLFKLVCYVRDGEPWRRGHGLQLRTHGPRGVRAPRAVGELTTRLATTVGSRPRRARDADQRTPHRPVVAPRDGPL